MNLKHVEIYRALMICGTASGAADLLGISQPSVSRAVSQLEQDLGFPLFSRIRTRMVPTVEGRMLFTEVEALHLGLERLRSTATRIRDSGTGQLRVASLASLGVGLVPRAARIFSQKRRDSTVTIQILGSSSARDLVAAGVYDLGIVAEEVDMQGVSHRPFAQYKAVCVMGRKHPLASKAEIGLQDLHGVDFISMAPEDTSRQALDELCRLHGVQPNVTVETYYSSTACALALEGAGIALVNPMALAGFTERGLVAKRFTPSIYLRKFLIFPADREHSLGVRAFVRALYTARNEMAVED